VGYPNALKEMRSVHGVSVAGGTFPAQIWHDYMQVAKGGSCEQFPTTAKEPFTGSRYAGGSGAGYGSKYGSSRSSGGSRSYRSPSPSTSGGYRGYDRRAYEAPPQGGPTPLNPSPTPPPTPTPVPRRGGSGDNGGGGNGGGGQDRGGTPPG